MWAEKGEDLDFRRGFLPYSHVWGDPEQQPNPRCPSSRSMATTRGVIVAAALLKELFLAQTHTLVLSQGDPGVGGMPLTAFITGITGQDGSYLAELLLDKGYEVHGLIRRSSVFGTGRIDHLYVDPHVQSANMFLHYGDLSDGNTLSRLMQEIQPNEVYNLGAQSHVAVSFQNPIYTADIDALGTLRLLEAVRSLDQPVRFYQASSSEMYGQANEVPQNEQTRFHPRSPYGIAKLHGYWQTVNYREAYGLFTCNGILFGGPPVEGTHRRCLTEASWAIHSASSEA